MIQTERPFADGRRTAVFVFNELKASGGRLTQLWLARLAAFDAAGWATHAVLVNKDAHLADTLRTLVAQGRFPRATSVAHYPLRDRRIRPSWWTPLAPGQSIDPRVGDWLDWLTAQVPGAVVFADSPAAYPYLAHMSNPLVARVAGIHLNHLTAQAHDEAAAMAPMTPRFAERFEPFARAFDALVVMTDAQAVDLRARLGQGTPTVVIPPSVAPPGPSVAAIPDPFPGARRIVSVAPLEEASRLDHVLRAAAPALRADPLLVVDLVGAGDAGDRLARVAGELGIAERVRILPPARDEHAPLAGAALAVWAGRRESCPLAIVRALACGVPVVAYDARYGPASLLADPGRGTLVPSGDEAGLSRAIAGWLRRRPTTDEVLDAASALLRTTDPGAVGSRWVALAAEMSDLAWDARSPAVLVDSVSTSSRVLRMPGILASSRAELTAWSIELPGLVEPAGWMVEPSRPTGAPDEDTDEVASPEHGPGPVRDVVVQVRSNALAFVATETAEPFRLEFTDGTTSTPLRSMAFEDRVIASRVGNATLSRHPDGTLWVTPLAQLLTASNVDGRMLVRPSPDSPPSDVTHAVDWIVDIAWSDLRATDEGAAFTGVLRATSIAPSEDSTPAICVADVGGYSRTVGQLHYTGPATVDGLSWSAPVDGVIATEPLVATTQLARGALPLHVGFRGLLVPIGGLWTHGHRTPIPLTCARGGVTLLPSPGGRVLAAPGKGYRARVSGAVRVALGRGWSGGG